MFPVVHLGHGVDLPIYILVISSIFSLGLVWIVQRAEARDFDRGITLDFALAIMLGGFVGARLLHVVYEAPAYYLEDPLAVLQIWRGGFVFYGGAIGALIAAEWVFRRNQLPHGPWQDLFAPLFPLGYAIGRLSCLAAGCCYGRPTDLPWAVTFPSGVEAPAGVALHPTQIYMALGEFILFLIVITLDRRKRMPAGSLFALWLVGHGTLRIIMEFFRADARGPQPLGLSISTWLSLALLSFGCYLWISARKSANAPTTRNHSCIPS